MLRGKPLAEFRSLAEVEADPRRREALRSAIVLLEDNARLQRELAQRIDDVRASRARLIDAAVGERRRLEGYVVEVRDGVYRGNLKAGEAPEYHRGPR